MVATGVKLYISAITASFIKIFYPLVTLGTFQPVMVIIVAKNFSYKPSYPRKL